MTTDNKAKPSGVKSQSTTEAKQSRAQNARLDRLEAAVAALAKGNASVAQDILDEHL